MPPIPAMKAFHAVKKPRTQLRSMVCIALFPRCSSHVPHDSVTDDPE